MYLLKHTGAYLLLQTRLSLAYSMQYMAIVMLSGRLYSPAVDLHAGLFEFDFMHVPPVAQAERVLYTPRKEAEKHATGPDGSRICAGPHAFVFLWTLPHWNRPQDVCRCDRHHFLMGT